MWMYFEDSPMLPISMINQIAEIEPLARDGVCCVPMQSVDLMLHARKGKYQSTQNRKDIRIRAIPEELAEPLAKELSDYIQISDVHFARKKTNKRWHLLECKPPKEGFMDIVLKFAPSTALKALVVDAGIMPADKVIKFKDICPPENMMPVELGYAPFAKAISKAPYWKPRYRVGRKNIKPSNRFTWPGVVEQHIHWWRTNAVARQYAEDDIMYTRQLCAYLGNPEESHDDILTAYVAATRWKGFAIDREAIVEAKEAAIKRVTIRTDPSEVRQKLLETLNPIERAVLSAQNKTGISTGKVVLEKLALMGHKYAGQVLDTRKAHKEIELYDKLLIAGRLHASLKIGGTLSNRMAGADGLNVQAINNLKRVRALFPLADFSGRTECTGCKNCSEKDKTTGTKKQLFKHYQYDFTEKPSTGDFESFEVVIAEAIYQDPNLRQDLLTCEDCGGEMAPYQLSMKCGSCGGSNSKKIHGLMGMSLYPGNDYDAIKRSKATENDMYTNGKRGVFALLYGGTGYTIHTKIGIPLKIADVALEEFLRKYIKMGLGRSQIETRFTALRQPNGLGTKVSYCEPAEKIQNMFDFNRYFTLENLVIKRLFELSSNLPAKLAQAGKRIKVIRRVERGMQSGDGALRTALLGAAFGQQSANIRAAQNTEIQSSGAESCKRLQVSIATIQPRGIHEWVVRALQVHDSISTVSKDDTVVKEIVNRIQIFVDDLRKRVPLLGIDWIENATSWAD